MRHPYCKLIKMLRKEKTKIIIILTLLSVITITWANHKPPMQKILESDLLTLPALVQNIIINDYINALDSFSQGMPIIGGDTESTWAADTVHTMVQRVKEGHQSFLKNMADIYQMHSYIAYGMSYYNAIIGLPHDTTKLCNFVLKDMLASSDSLHQAIIANDYKNIKTWNDLRFESILNMQLFNTLNGMNNQPTYTDSDLGYQEAENKNKHLQKQKTFN